MSVTRVFYEGKEVEICAEANRYMNQFMTLRSMTKAEVEVEYKLRKYDEQKILELDKKKYEEVHRLRSMVTRLHKDTPYAEKQELLRSLRRSQEAYRKIHQRMVYLTDLCVLLSCWITTVRSSSATATEAATAIASLTAPTSKIPPVLPELVPQFALDPPTPPVPPSIPFVASPVLDEMSSPVAPNFCKECESIPCQCEDLNVEEPNSADEDSKSEDKDYVPSN